MVSESGPEAGNDDPAGTRRRWRGVEGLAGLAIGLAALYLAVRNVRLEDLLRAWRETDHLLLGGVLVLILSSTAASAMRWQSLLHPQRPGVGKLFSILLVSRLAGSILPWKLGTLVRSYLVSVRSDVGLAFALGSVALDRLLDLGIILILFLVVLPSTILPTWLRDSGLGALLVSLPIFGLLILMIRSRLALINWLERRLAGYHLAPRFQGWVQALRHATDTLANLSRVESAGRIMLSSLWQWSAAILANYVAMRALNIPLSLSAAVVLLLALQLGTKLPGAPADIGIFHFIAVQVLTGFGVDKALALSYGLALHAIVYLGPALLGAVVITVSPRTLGFETLGQVGRDCARLFRQVRGEDGGG